MTSTTVHTTVHTTGHTTGHPGTGRPTDAAPGRLRGAFAAWWSAAVAERRDLRRYRAQERAFADLGPSERNDALAAARRS